MKNKKIECDLCPHPCVNSINRVSSNVYDELTHIIEEIEQKSDSPQFGAVLRAIRSYLRRDNSIALDKDGIDTFMKAYNNHFDQIDNPN